MSYSKLFIENSESRLSFSLRVDTTRPWWRDLDLDGEPIYRIGNICDTCEAIFKRFNNANLSITPSQLSNLLRSGFDRISQDVIETVSKILPKGDYVIALLEVSPTLVDFQAQEKEKLDFYRWENSQPVHVPDSYWPQYPFTKTWQVTKSPGTQENTLYEGILPLINRDNFNPDTVFSYQEKIKGGIKPTALAFSIVDIRFLSSVGFDWQLIHILLDGHHKMMAASQLNMPITVLSFLNITESWATSEWIGKTIQLRYGS